MTADQIEANAERGANSDDEDSPWHTDWGQMARKTVLKRLLNYVPLGKIAGEIIRPAAAECVAEDGQESATSRSAPAGGSELFQQYMVSINTAALEGIDAAIAAIRGDDRLDHEEKTQLFNRAVQRKRELRKS